MKTTEHPAAIEDRIERAYRTAMGRTAILIRLAGAEQTTKRGYTEPDLDKSFWQGIEDLSRETYDSLQGMYVDALQLGELAKGVPR